MRCCVLGQMSSKVEATTVPDRLRCLSFSKRNFAVVHPGQIQNISPSKLSNVLLSVLEHLGIGPCMKMRNGILHVVKEPGASD